MTEERKNLRIDIDKKKEMRTKEISKMIGEGGLGAYKYYDYPKKSKPKKETRSEEISKMIDEGGMASSTYYNEKTIPNFNNDDEK